MSSDPIIQNSFKPNINEDFQDESVYEKSSNFGSYFWILIIQFYYINFSLMHPQT